MEAIEICESFSHEIFHNRDASNIIVRIETPELKNLTKSLLCLDYAPKRVVRESKTHSIINFEKIYPFSVDF
jgi:hypothetical protein